MVEQLYTPEQLNQMHQQLWNCVLQFADFSAVQERNRIARDLHDSLGAALTALNFQLQTAIKCQPASTQAQPFLTEAQRLATIATQEVRQSVRSLRDDAINTQSIDCLLTQLVNDFHSSTGIQPILEIQPALNLPTHLTTPVYRIVQEALTNIQKYAQATIVGIKLDHGATGIKVEIQDNGRGFSLDCIYDGYGLRGMQERVAVFQGKLIIDSRVGQGCCITAIVPVSLPQLEMPRPAIEISEWQPLDLDQW